ncbi:MAG: L-2-amino-thiazoline-4-carboxylic acid hydrolase [Spirochaetaceae bacterium]|nr:L-2-amino-thiazoline-4-carboxylic acid hydrolase [Spirochaetaceae bacterium]
MSIMNTPSIHEDKIDLARACIEHRATWMALTFLEMQKRGLDAEGITRAAVRQTGHIHGARIKEKTADVEDLRDFNAAFLNEDGRKNFEIDIVEAEHDHLKAEFHYCALVSAWQKLGLDEATIALLCDIAMDGDRGIAEAMGYTLDLSDTIAKGCKTCKLHFHK